MYRILIAASALAVVSACDDGQPFFQEDETTTEDTTTTTTDGDTTEPDPVIDETGGVDAASLPPGTPEPQVDEGIVRYETVDANGGGRITSPVSYNALDDTFSVDNLAFDGENIYQRGTAVSQMGGYAVYDAEVAVSDSLTGNRVGQIIPYRAILGVSTNTTEDSSGTRVPRSSFAIVRTGGYVDYGFGGFVYEREGGVVLPDTGQATFSGGYGGIRVFQDRGGLEFTRGDMIIDVDFDDFNSNDGVKGRIINREAFTAAGNSITTGTGDGQLQLPNVTFVVTEGAGGGIDDNGEIVGQVASTAVIDGEAQEYETGTYYAVVSGDLTDPADGGEIVGVIVMESTDPRFDVSAQETGGFIVYR
ncbi:hypothetical protein [Roseisalinus antarcticus]|uniref:Uncharacterized protein n=1 Tax=Roseisalinus antarcticus TaxID=254357 RepID=A0A1Y5STJ2_9RHOB|nr:hypothetical protein [Roseisalinus antarcticus]SLN48080.1 hypothetical protein ROA7023_02062 [Roseisalinus antarcticus]